MRTIVFDKKYDYESLYDLGRDIGEFLEALEELDLPKDRLGFIQGTFKVTIEHQNARLP